MDLRIKKSTRALLDASFQVLLVNPRASLSEIAKLAGVGRATLYRHYSTREELIAAIAIESLDLIEQSLAPIIAAKQSGLKAVEAMVEKLLPLADRFHFLQTVWTIAELDRQVWAMYETQMNQIWLWIDEGQKKGEIHAELSAEWIVAVIDSMLYSASWMLNQSKMPEQHVKEQFLILLKHGITTE